MTRKFRKDTRKNRAIRYNGYGKIHRGKGKSGGAGLTTGRFKHMRSRYMVQMKLGFPDPAWKLGKHGKPVPPDIQRMRAVNSINIVKLEDMVDSWVADGKAEKKGTTYVVDLDKLDIQKLIGRGKITKKFEITVQKASESAQEKLKEAKCKLTLLAADEE
jgi:large subunit ribosomal protein L15